MDAVLDAVKRSSRGKNEARRLRASGKIPAVVYGVQKEGDAPKTVEVAVVDAVPETLAKIRAAETRDTGRVWIEIDQDNKYEVAGPDIPCAELLHLCQARCCRMGFPLSTADLDEGVIRFEYTRPYLIRHRALDGYCVHSTEHKTCGVYAQRPAICRSYDCRRDKRIWTDFENKVPAPWPNNEPAPVPDTDSTT